MALRSPSLDQCWLKTLEEFLWKFQSKFKSFHWRKCFLKCRLRNIRHFVLVAVCWCVIRNPLQVESKAECQYDDAYTLQEVSKDDLTNFHWAAGIVPVILNLIKQVQTVHSTVIISHTQTGEGHQGDCLQRIQWRPGQSCWRPFPLNVLEAVIPHIRYHLNTMKDLSYS